MHTRYALSIILFLLTTAISCASGTPKPQNLSAFAPILQQIHTRYGKAVSSSHF